MARVCEGGLDGLDGDTMNLIIQLQLQDAASYSSSSKGKGRENEVSDESLAFHLQTQELEVISSFLSDRRMAQSFADAVQNDAQALREALSQEDIAARDQRMARRLYEGAHPTHVQLEAGSEEDFLDDEYLAKLRVLYVSGLRDEQQDLGGTELECAEKEQPESSSWAAKRVINLSSNERRCESCQELKPFSDVARVPCRHEYCRACLGFLFEASMTDESLFPPRCCGQPIPTTKVRVFLTSNLVENFEKKKIEFETPNRTYCCSLTCSSFIGAQNISGEAAMCLDCGWTTCTTCKAAAHEGDCPNDTALQQVLDAAAENGWQRCYSCWRVVELDHGCNHITCRCGAQFCYVCGQRWRNCNCAQWDEHRLLIRAHEIVDREPQILPGIPDPVDMDMADLPRTPEDLPQALADPPQTLTDPLPELEEPSQPIRELRICEDPLQAARDVLVEQTIRMLRENHECDHSRWRRVPGPHSCEECYGFLRQYIFECRQCQLQACNRCRRNRL